MRTRTPGCPAGPGAAFPLLAGALALVVVTTLAPAPVHAQSPFWVTGETTSIGFFPFLDLGDRPGYYPDDDPRDELIIDAHLAPNIRFYGDLETLDLFDGRDLTWSVGFTPALRFRALREPSSPIKSPSFMPNLFVEAVKVVKGGAGSKAYGFGLAYAHHSNGGEGCEFRDETLVGDTCAVSETDRARPASVRGVTPRVGNFTTNYFEPFVHGGYFHVGPPPDGDTHFDWYVRGRLGVELHPPGIPHVFGSGASDAFLDLYGWWRPRLEVWVERFWVKSNRRLRAELGLEYTVPSDDVHPDFAPYQLRLAVLYQPGWFPDAWMIQARGYLGHDEYNVEYIRNVSMLSFGLAWMPWQPFREVDG